MHPVDLLAPVSPISWDNIALRGVQAPIRAGRDGKRLNSTVYGYTFLLATLMKGMYLGRRFYRQMFGWVLLIPVVVYTAPL